MGLSLVCGHPGEWFGRGQSTSVEADRLARAYLARRLHGTGRM